MIARRIRLMVLAPLALLASACTDSKYWPTQPTEPTVPPTQPLAPPDPQVVEGRPLRRRNGRARTARSRHAAVRHAALNLTDRQALALPTSTRLAIGDHWRRSGEFEHASIAAFNDLAARLRRLDAPADLVARAERSAQHEADHADRCFALASRYLGAEVVAGRLRQPRRRLRNRQTELSALAVEGIRDGMFNEGLAAWLAVRGRDRARDHRVIETLGVIAADETGHAQLSADVVQWALQVGGAAVAESVTVSLAQMPSELSVAAPPAAADVDALADHGVTLPGEAVRMGCADIRAGVIDRVTAMLRSSAPAAITDAA